MNYKIRSAIDSDLDQLLELVKRLGELELLPQRDSTMFWEGDAQGIKEWAAKKDPNREILVAAADDDATVLGFIMFVFTQDWLSHEANVYIDALAVSDRAEGLGIGKGLLLAVEAVAKERGIRLLSLQVVGTNARARRLYQKMGYTEEVIRNTKFLDS